MASIASSAASKATALVDQAATMAVDVGHLAISAVGSAAKKLATLSIDGVAAMDEAGKTAFGSTSKVIFESAAEVLRSDLGPVLLAIPGFFAPIEILFKAVNCVWQAAIVSKHNKANCRLAADRAHLLLLAICEISIEYHHCDMDRGQKFMQTVDKLSKLIVEDLLKLIQKYSNYGRLRQLMLSDDFHRTYERISMAISQHMEIITANLSTLAVFQNRQILDSMRFNEILATIMALKDTTEGMKEDTLELNKKLEEKITKVGKELEMHSKQLKDMKLVVEKNFMLQEKNAALRARMLQSEMVAVLDQVVRGQQQEQKHAAMMLASQRWIKGILSKRNDREEVERIIETATLQHNIDRERIRFHDMGKPLARSDQFVVYEVQFGGDKCVAKVIRTEDLTFKTRLELYNSFKEEFTLMCSVRHPRIIQVYGVVMGTSESEQLVLVMEHAKLGSLRNLLNKRQEGMGSNSAYALAYDIACGMEALYKQGIHHRDLKADNVLLNEHARAKICDFGLSRADQLKEFQNVRADSRESYPWMAPERLRGDEDMDDEKGDVYSFAITMWEIVTGQRPWAELAEENNDKIKDDVISGKRPTIDETGLREKYDITITRGNVFSLLGLIKQCWDDDPEKRPDFKRIVKELFGVVQLLQFSGGYIVEDELAAEQQEELKKEIEKKKREDEKKRERKKKARLIRYFSVFKDGIEANRLSPQVDRVNRKYLTENPPAVVQAAGGGAGQDVAVLLQWKETDVNARGSGNTTALHEATKKEDIAILKQLLNHEAIIIDLADRVGKIPLHYAAAMGSKKVVKLLLKKNRTLTGEESMDVGATDKKYYHTPLHYAALQNSEEVVGLLIQETGLNINPRSKYGNTPLMDSALRGYVKVFRMLLKTQFIDLAPKANNGDTMLHKAAVKGRTEVVKTILDFDEHLDVPLNDVNTHNINGTTALHNAAKDGHTKVVELLLAVPSIDVNARDNYKNTPLWYARDYPEVEALLISKGGVKTKLDD